MLISLLLFLFSLIFPFTLSDWLTPQETVAANYKCDAPCWFNETEVNSTSIVNWPVNCSTVCSYIYFASNADVPMFNLQSYFKNLKVLKGGLDMRHSEYISTSFFPSLEEIYCKELGISLAFNNGLKELVFPKLKIIDCSFYAYNNSKLDATEFCDQIEDLTEMFVYDNFKNCRGCVSGKIDYDTVKTYRNCSALVGPTTITDTYVSQGTDMSALATVLNINGSFDVYRTDLPDLSLFQSLKFIKSNHYYQIDMDLHDNPQMKRINISSLETLKVTDGYFLLSIMGVHPDFCITTNEMDMFMRNDVMFNNLEAAYCTNETEENVCEFEALSFLEDSCAGVLGNVFIDSGDEAYVEKLKNVKTIYGSLIVQNTTLTSLDFLASLEYIVLLNETFPAFQISSNIKLEDVDMPSLKRVHSNSKYQISFDGNGEGLLNSTACLNLMSSLLETNVVFDGRECEAIDRGTDSPSTGCGQTSVLVPLLSIILVSLSSH